MSHFPNMFKSSDKISSYLVQTNNFGETVVYSLGEDGGLLSFACGDVVHVLGDAVSNADPRSFLVSLNKHLDIRHPCSWFHDYFSYKWSEAIAVLNGKPTAARRGLRAECRLYRYLGMPIGRFVVCERDRTKPGGEHYRLTPEAEEWDRKQGEKEAKK